MVGRAEIFYEKIADERLRDFLHVDTDATIQVLLEVEAPEPVVTYRGKRREGVMDIRRHSVGYPKKAQETERRAIKQTRSLLDTLQIKCRFLQSARVFLVEVNSDQLRKILAAPTIRAVIPNRRVTLID